MDEVKSYGRPDYDACKMEKLRLEYGRANRPACCVSPGKSETAGKGYKNYRSICIGSSDIACVILAGIDGKKDALVTKPLKFGGDGSYHAYLVTDEDAEIGPHYHLDSEFSTWLKIYDDNGLAETIRADIIKVYRAKEMGCIIQAYNRTETTE